MVDRLSRLRRSAGVTAEDCLPQNNGLFDDEETRAGNNYGAISMTKMKSGDARYSDAEAGGSRGIKGKSRNLNMQKYMQQLMESHSELNSLISQFTVTTTSLKMITKESVMCTSTQQEKMLARKMSDMVDEGKMDMMRVKELLDALTSLQKKSGNKMTPAESQLCNTILITTSKKFKDAVAAFMKAQEDYKKEVKNKLTRQLAIAYPDAGDEDLSEIVEQDPDIAREAITKQLAGSGHANLQNVVMDMEEKWNDLKKLEQSVIELHQLFLYVATLVDEQSHMLDSIESHVEQTKEYTGAAVEQLQDAAVYKENYEKNQWLLWAVGSGSFFVIALIIFFSCGGPSCCSCLFSCCCPGNKSETIREIHHVPTTAGSGSGK